MQKAAVGLFVFLIGCQDNISIQKDIIQQKEVSISIQGVLFCPNDMIEINGEYCPEIQETCINLDKSVYNGNGYVKCDKFAPTKCLLKTRVHMKFCIDTFEYPNHKNELPTIMVSWNEMKDNCEKIGKRLCSDKEWTFACEGEDMLPYPYGLTRDSSACNIDHPQKSNFDASKDFITTELVKYLDQRVPSGFYEKCVSPFGVRDMTGNVDEVVINSSRHPYKSAEKGGAWILGHRNKCRAITLPHNEEFKYYEIGGRCCK